MLAQMQWFIKLFRFVYMIVLFLLAIKSHHVHLYLRYGGSGHSLIDYPDLKLSSFGLGLMLVFGRAQWLYKALAVYDFFSMFHHSNLT